MKKNTPAASNARLGSRFAVHLATLLLPVLALAFTAPVSQGAIEASRIATGFTIPLYVGAPPRG